MNDFYGKEIKVGDTVELRTDGNDKGSAFRRGVVTTGQNEELTIEYKRQALEGHIYRSEDLSYLSMSNDIVKVESE